MWWSITPFSPITGSGCARSPPRLDSALAQKLNRYQSFGVTPGPALAVAVLLAAVCRMRPGRSGLHHLRWAAALLATSGLLLLLVPAATAAFEYRYMLPSLVCIPPAGVVAALVLFRGARRHQPPSPTGPRSSG